MESMRFNDVHKSKLLEMCKVLFPEWKSHNMSYLGFISDDTLNYSESDATFTIHWFEFCCTILADELCKKLLKLNAYNNSNDFRSDLYTYTLNDHEYTSHIVDYLYEEFKQLKQNE